MPYVMGGVANREAAAIRSPKDTLNAYAEDAAISRSGT